ncbi:unnamed protein product, partial [Choristocarpus tenellus]
MHEKIASKDFQGVIDVMRAATCPYERRGRKLRKAPGTGHNIGWSPTEETYMLGLEACSQVNRRWSFKVALTLLQDMRKDPNIELELKHYRSAILACSKTRELPVILSFMDEMKSKGIQPDGVDRVLDLLKQMRAEFLPTEATYDIVLRLCGQAGNWTTSLQVLSDMEVQLIPSTPH